MRPDSRLLTPVLAVAAAGCIVRDTAAPPATAASAAPVAGSAGGSSKPAPIVRGPSGLPVPPGGGVPRPNGTPGNLKVLDWAGFTAAVSYTFDDTNSSQIQ